jgi:hypothetical protein
VCEKHLEESAVTANELLLWMSARGQGSWSQFRAAVEELDIAEREDTLPVEADDGPGGRPSLPLHQSLRLNFQRLAHAEFFVGAGGDDWRVTPPSLSIVPHGPCWLAVVTGARSDRLLRRLHSAAGPFEIETVPLNACPDLIRLVANDAAAFSGVASSAGMLLQSDAPHSILTSLPPVDHPAVRRPDDLPFGVGWNVEQFSTRTLDWKLATRDAALNTAAGLFRFSLAYRSQVLLCSRGTAYQIPAQVGKYYVLRWHRKKILSYDAVNRRLSIPASCRPPFLVERALILCSGIPPSYERRPSMVGLLHYSDIPEAIAKLAAALLRQGSL